MRKMLVVLSALMLAGCGAPKEEATEPTATTVPAEETPAATEEAPAEEAAAPAEGDETAAETSEEGEAHEHAEAASCSCPAGKEGDTVWCGSCGKGYIAGESTTDKGAVDEALAATE